MDFDKYNTMEDLLDDLKKQEKIENLLKEKGLSLTLAKIIIRVWGLKSLEVAQKLGISKSTIERYVSALGKLTESEFQLIKENA